MLHVRRYSHHDGVRVENQLRSKFNQHGCRNVTHKSVAIGYTYHENSEVGHVITEADDGAVNDPLQFAAFLRPSTWKKHNRRLVGRESSKKPGKSALGQEEVEPFHSQEWSMSISPAASPEI